MSWAIFLASGGVTAGTESEIVWVFLLAGVVSMAVTEGAPQRHQGQ